MNETIWTAPPKLDKIANDRSQLIFMGILLKINILFLSSNHFVFDDCRIASLILSAFSLSCINLF